MNYDFIRKLAVKVSEQEAGAIIKLLLSHNIETYAEGTSEERKRGRMYVAIQSEPVNATVLSSGNLYVAAADRARAIEILGENGYDAVICRDEQEAAVLTRRRERCRNITVRENRTIWLRLQSLSWYSFFFFCEELLAKTTK